MFFLFRRPRGIIEPSSPWMIESIRGDGHPDHVSRARLAGTFYRRIAAMVSSV
jgi:hypothetical protein